MTMTGRERSIAIIFEGYPHVGEAQRLLAEAHIETGRVPVEELMSEELRDAFERLDELNLYRPHESIVDRCKKALSGLRLIR